MADPRTVYQLKVTLRHATPPIWRRVLVLADDTLEDLHRTLQIAMGWEESHLHEFEAGGTSYGRPDTESPDRSDERKVRLRSVLRKRGDRLAYQYDFGDSWEHDVVLEKAIPAERGMRYPFVVGGKRACPPEDCGGVGGYESFLEALRDPHHPEHADMLEWIGGSFDPEAFDAQARNRAFHGGWGSPDAKA